MYIKLLLIACVRFILFTDVKHTYLWVYFLWQTPANFKCLAVTNCFRMGTRNRSACEWIVILKQHMYNRVANSITLTLTLKMRTESLSLSVGQGLSSLTVQWDVIEMCSSLEMDWLSNVSRNHSSLLTTMSRGADVVSVCIMRSDGRQYAPFLYPAS
jgi:hypothetical protein